MKTKATIKDVAMAAGASIGLTSMIINGKAPARCKKKDAVLKAIRKLNYIPNRSAAELRQGVRKKIGVITPDLSNHYFSEVSRSIENIAYDNGYIVLFGSSDDSPKKFASILETFVKDGVSGLIVTPCEGVRESLNNVVKMGIPVVLINRDIDAVPNVGKVFLDNRKAIRMGIDYLRSKGYDRIAMISDDSIISSQQLREREFKEIMQSEGKKIMMEIVGREYNLESYVSAINKIKDLGANAILIPKGYLTLYVFKAMKELGLRTPSDFALIGFDGGITYELVSPSIAQIDQPVKDTGVESFNMICEMIANPNSRRTVLLEPSIKEGESV